NYTVVASVTPRDFQSSGNALIDAMARGTETARAAAAAQLHDLERYQGAVLAGDATYEHVQLRALGEAVQKQIASLEGLGLAARDYASELAQDPANTVPQLTQQQLEE